MEAELAQKLDRSIHFPTLTPIIDIKPYTIWGHIKKFLTDRRRFLVEHDYYLWIAEIKMFIYIPKGFIYDGASVPKFFYSIFSPTGMLFFGSGPHDEGYRYKGLYLMNEFGKMYFVPFSKRELDKIFGHLCEMESGLVIAPYVAQFMLTLFGFTGWLSARWNNKHHKLDFPHVPRILLTAWDGKRILRQWGL
jgi:hypothetical protein